MAVFKLTDFGADPTGQTDSTVALIACRDKARAGAGVIALGDGNTYLIDGTAIPRAGGGANSPRGLEVWNGALTGRSLLRWKPGTGRAIQAQPDASFRIDGPTFELIGRQNDDGRPGAILAHSGLGKLDVRNVTVRGPWVVGIAAQRGSTVHDDPLFTMSIRRCDLDVTGTAISHFTKLGVTQNHLVVQDTIIRRCGQDLTPNDESDEAHGHGVYCHPNVVQSYQGLTILKGGRYGFRLGRGEADGVAPPVAQFRKVVLGRELDQAAHLMVPSVWRECEVRTKIGLTALKPVKVAKSVLATADRAIDGAQDIVVDQCEVKGYSRIFFSGTLRLRRSTLTREQDKGPLGHS
jgi:hypothetical protein